MMDEKVMALKLAVDERGRGGHSFTAAVLARLSNEGFAEKLTIEALGIAKVFNFFDIPAGAPESG